MFSSRAPTTVKFLRRTLNGGSLKLSAPSIGATHKDSPIGAYGVQSQSRTWILICDVSDIKPHNFVLTTSAHVLLIDFGSAAPLIPPRHDGSQLLEKRYCLMLCGTCDYISPEVLRAHEEALVALEMEDDDDGKGVPRGEYDTEGYGLETDWWSLGAMMYEMAYGVAPFFAKDIRQTYLKIMNHKVFFNSDSCLLLSSLSRSSYS
jgi:serine/threonine protein kinase